MACSLKTKLRCLLIIVFWVFLINISIIWSAPHTVGKVYNSRTGAKDFCLQLRDDTKTVDNIRCLPVRVPDGSFSDETTYFRLKAGASEENVNTSPKTGDYTVLVTDENLIFDTTNSEINVTLLAAPVDGKKLGIILQTAVKQLIVKGNGKEILGETTLTMNTTGEAIQMIYTGTQWDLK